jgi:hypothetical protein
MYGRSKPDPNQSSSDKNPNRVTGGLKAQGVDRFTMISEDGVQQEIPTIEYVRSLEDQSKKQRAAITVLERKLSRQDTSIQQIQANISRLLK